jgi:hypothetical protein
MVDPPGGVPEWPKGTGCKPVGSAFRGSNPLSPISVRGQEARTELRAPQGRREPADYRWVKRAAAVIVAIVALAAVGAASYASGVIPGTDGCVLRSVDKESYVAGNEAVFSTIRLPDYLLEADTNTYSIGIPSSHSCFPNENGPPFESYITWHVFIQPLGQYSRGFDRTSLGPEWVSPSGGPIGGDTFRRGAASLYITTSDEATSFGVDHSAYPKPG